jgi:hypothetical protein
LDLMEKIPSKMLWKLSISFNPKDGKNTPFWVIETAPYSSKFILAQNGGHFFIQYRKMV